MIEINNYDNYQFDYFFDNCNRFKSFFSSLFFKFFFLIFFFFFRGIIIVLLLLLIIISNIIFKSKINTFNKFVLSNLYKFYIILFRNDFIF